MRHTRHSQVSSRRREHLPGSCATARGFSLIELLVVIVLIGLITAMVAPNLEAFVPKLRMESAAKKIVANIDHMRSEARIQGKRCKLEFDLDKARWRRAFPPEERLTTDQDVDSLEPRLEDWSPVDDNDGVKIASAGNPVEGLARGGVFALVFDENGFTGDQTLVLSLVADPTMTWTINIRGLTGQCEVLADFEGREHLPEEVGEGSF